MPTVFAESFSALGCGASPTGTAPAHWAAAAPQGLRLSYRIKMGFALEMNRDHPCRFETASSTGFGLFW